MDKDPKGEWFWPRGQQCPGPEVRASSESGRRSVGWGVGMGARAWVAAIGVMERSQSTWGLAGHDEQFRGYSIEKPRPISLNSHKQPYETPTLLLLSLFYRRV